MARWDAVIVCTLMTSAGLMLGGYVLATAAPLLRQAWTRRRERPSNRDTRVIRHRR